MTYAASVEPGQEPGLTRMPLRKSWLDSVAAMLKRVSHVLSGLGVLLMLLVGAVMVVDVLVLRYVLRSPIVGSNEVYAAVAAVAISFLLAGGLASRSMLEVDVLAGKLGARPIAWLRCSGLALFLACLSVLAIALFEQAVNAFEAGFTSSLLGIAFWPSYALIFLAVALTVPVMIVNLLLSFRELPHQGLAARLSAPVFGFLLFAVGITLALQFQSLWHGNMIAFGAGVLLLLWIFILFFIPVAAALIFSALLGIVALLGWDAAVNILGSESVGLFTSVDISVIPFFLMMGGFAVASGMAADIYRFANALLSPFRGGLALATVWGCAGFGALCGSSIATVATIGSAAYPEMKQRGYSTQLSSGSIAAGGTLGQLIPPSTVVIVYALLVGESIGQLYIAILLPALITIIFYSVAIFGMVTYGHSAPGGRPWDYREIRESAIRCIPVVLLFIAVIGGIFTGIFTVNEAAAVGAILAFVVTLCRGKLSSGGLWDVAAETTRSTSMIYFLLIGGMTLTFMLATTNLPPTLSQFLQNLEQPPWVVVSLLLIGLIVLGTVLDSMTIMMVIAPTAAVAVTGFGYDPIWWAIMMVIVVELGVVTPPFGLNLFVLRSVAPDLQMSVVYRGVMPFVVADLLKIALLFAIPSIPLLLLQ